MRITRIYTGGDGQSHFEELELSTIDVGRGANRAETAVG